MMRSTDQDFAGTYRGLTADEIAALYVEIGSLTEEAHSALMAEIQRRGLDEAQLKKMHTVELRHEAQFDRREKLRRKKMVLEGFSGMNDVKGWILAILGALVFILISELINRRH
jgi:hypothetical protein